MKTGIVIIGENVVETLLAYSEQEQSRGLMFVESPTPAMSFVYTEPRINKFWMQNTPSDLDIIFCLKNKISQIHRGRPFSTEAIGNNEFSDLVIELPYGSFHSMGLKIGTPVKII